MSFNNTTTTAAPSSSGNLKFELFVKFMCMFVFILGLVGNSLVLIVFGRRWSKLKNCEVYMMSLAVADLLATVTVPIRLFLELNGHDFYDGGHVGCKIMGSLAMTTVTVSALTLLVISIDRFIIVKWPLRGLQTSSKNAITICIIWLISFALSSIFLFRAYLYDDPADDSSQHLCRVFYLSDREASAHGLASFTVQIVIPLSIMSVLYSLIALELRKTAKSHLIRHHKNEMRARLKRNRKAIILFVTLVTVFYVFVLPSSIFYLFYLYDGLGSLPDNQVTVIYSLLHLMLMLNSCVNPIIYSNLHTSFRRSTLKIFCSCLFTKFKDYQWGEGPMTLLLNRTRSFRESFQSRRESLFSRRQSSDDGLIARRRSADEINHNNQAVSYQRNMSLELPRTPRNQQFNKNSSLEVSMTNGIECSYNNGYPRDLKSKHFKIEEDNVFNEFNRNNNNATSQKSNGHTRKKFVRNSTVTSTLNASPPPSPITNEVINKDGIKRQFGILQKQKRIEQEDSLLNDESNNL